MAHSMIDHRCIDDQCTTYNHIQSVKFDSNDVEIMSSYHPVCRLFLVNSYSVTVETIVSYFLVSSHVRSIANLRPNALQREIRPFYR